MKGCVCTYNGGEEVCENSLRKPQGVCENGLSVLVRPSRVGRGVVEETSPPLG